jgi:branched-chain amino acid transport system permease protein
MSYLATLVVHGALAGAVYALIAVAFIVVYKAARMANFALGEWVMLGALLTGAAANVLPFGVLVAMVIASGGLVLLANAFSRLVLARLIGRPAIAVIMITLGLGALLRGLDGLILRRLPTGLPALAPVEAIEVAGLALPASRLWAAAIAIACIGAVALFYRWSRAGLALRALADDSRAALVAGIDAERYVALAWSLAGLLCVVAGVLWSTAAGGGFGLALVGLKVFPVVVIGGLDSIGGAVVAAALVGIVESVASGYLDPLIGAGFGGLAGFALLIGVLLVRPHGFGGRAPAERV